MTSEIAAARVNDLLERGPRRMDSLQGHLKKQNKPSRGVIKLIFAFLMMLFLVSVIGLIWHIYETGKQDELLNSRQDALEYQQNLADTTTIVINVDSTSTVTKTDITSTVIITYTISTVTKGDTTATESTASISSTITKSDTKSTVTTADTTSVITKTETTSIKSKVHTASSETTADTTSIVTKGDTKSTETTAYTASIVTKADTKSAHTKADNTWTETTVNASTTRANTLSLITEVNTKSTQATDDTTSTITKADTTSTITKADTTAILSKASAITKTESTAKIAKVAVTPAFTKNPTKTRPKRTTTVTTVAAAVTSTDTVESIGNVTAFKIRQMKELTYNNYQFLALQVEVPSAGLSRSENWCRDYQYLCEGLGRRPTGCGLNTAPSPDSKYKTCRDEYNSDMDIGNVLSCNASPQIAAINRLAFPDASPAPTVLRTAFGFSKCTRVYCQKTIEGSARALPYMNNFWLSNVTVMYTVCR